jgi:hypothetical protein
MNPYTNFLNLLQGLLQLEKFPAMTALSKLILDQIALHEDIGKPLTNCFPCYASQTLGKFESLRLCDCALRGS